MQRERLHAQFTCSGGERARSDEQDPASGGQGLRPYDPVKASGGQGYPPLFQPLSGTVSVAEARIAQLRAG
jgi:hypothetical protein